MIALDESRRQEAIDAGWSAYAERLHPKARTEYLRFCDQWSVIAICDDGEVIGALFAKDGVIHIGIVPHWRGRWASRRLIREMLAYGKTTTLLPEESACHEFIARLGFEPAGNGKHEYKGSL